MPGRRARDDEAQRRLPFEVLHEGRRLPVGTVAREHVAVLAQWPQWLHCSPQAVCLVAAAHERDAALAHINRALFAGGLLPGWRDELFDICSRDGTVLARHERAGSRFWGTRTLGAHCTGWVAGADGRPSHLWLGERAATKSTDPGKLDNLVGGGVGAGQTPARTLVREAWEEAGLQPAQVRAAQPGRVIEMRRRVAEGLQHEWLHSWDLALPPGVQPRNQDGEVAAFHCLPVAEALALAATDAMTVDAALVTLDFALRHGLVDAKGAVAQAFASLCVAGADVQAI